MLDPNLVVSETEFWEAAVSTAEQRFHKLCDEAEAMSIQGYLQDGTVVYWNRASEMIYGYSAQEAIGRNLLDLIIPRAAWAVVQHDMAQMFETGKGIPAARLTLRHKDGHPVSVFSSHTVVALPGHPKVMFCMDADMSALAQAEEELRIAATAFESQQGMHHHRCARPHPARQQCLHAGDRLSGRGAARPVTPHLALRPPRGRFF